MEPLEANSPMDPKEPESMSSLEMAQTISRKTALAQDKVTEAHTATISTSEKL